MLKKLISLVVVIAALVALGEWAGKTFFPTPSPEDLQILQDRIDKGAWKTSARNGQADAAEENAASLSPSFRTVASSASTIPATSAPTASSTPYAEDIVFVAAKPSSALPTQATSTVSPTSEPTTAPTPTLTPAPTIPP